MARIDYTKLVKPDMPKRRPSKLALNALTGISLTLLALATFTLCLLVLAGQKGYERSSVYSLGQFIFSLGVGNVWVVLVVTVAAVLLLTWTCMLDSKYYLTVAQGEVVGRDYTPTPFGGFYYLKIRGYSLAGEVVKYHRGVQPYDYFKTKIGDYVDFR